MKGGGRSKAQAKDNKLAVKKGKATKQKSAKDPNKPKRPPSAFFVFMEDFRKQYKEKHPKNKSVAAVGKAAGDKWKSLTDGAKAPYVAKAEERKKEYVRVMQAYNKKLAEGRSTADDDESDKSKSEVNDEDDDEEGSEEEEEDDD